MTIARAGSPEGLQPDGGRPRDDERTTRKPLALWDRLKFLILLALLWFILVWSVMASDPLIGFTDAMRIEVTSAWWVFALFGLEVVRQLHFLISEHWAGYYRFWTQTVFGGWERMTRRKFSAWTRFRFWRVLIWLFWIAVIAVVAGKVTHADPVTALLKMPSYIWHALPFILQLMVILLFVVLQFGAIFWFLSRGGVDVYLPRRHQDPVHRRLGPGPRAGAGQGEHPLPGGPRADRVARRVRARRHPAVGPARHRQDADGRGGSGETGRPYVFVDPGAFINMFMGVGILKVKSLFRKLRRLALRYGGVIVFFDEADSLGSRGALAQGGPGFPRDTPAAWQAGGCHGFSYLSEDVQWRLAQRALSSSAGEEPDTRRNKQVMGMGMNGGGGMGTLQALLTELSGLKKPRGFINRHVRRLLGMRPKPPPKYRILVMLASNMPESLDEALLRPGRIDRIYKVGYPSKAGRVRTYEGYFAKVRNELTPEDIDKLATITPYATGATIKDLVNESLIHAIRDGRDVITWRDVIKAKQLKELGPAEDVEYIERERHAVAVHEACHALVAYRTRQHMEIDIATIEKGSDYLGHGGQHPARRTSSPGGAASTRPTSWSRWRRWPGSGCSSTTTAPRGSPVTWSRRPRWRPSWRASGGWGRRSPRTPPPSGWRSARPAAGSAAGRRRARTPRPMCAGRWRTGSRTA